MLFNKEINAMISYFDAHCDTVYRCMETGEVSALEYGESREEQRRYYAASGHLRKNGGHIDLERGRQFRRCAQFFACSTMRRKLRLTACGPSASGCTTSSCGR